MVSRHSVFFSFDIMAPATSPSYSQTLALYLGGLRILVHRLWVKVFGSSEPPSIAWRDRRILLVGLDGSGKSSLVRRAADSTAALDAQVAPTRGFAVHTVNVLPDWHCELWEIGGAANMRPYWPRYATYETEGVAWVVDGADVARLGESARALAELYRGAPILRSLPLLILVTKTDAPEPLMSAEAAAQGLALEALAASGACSGPRKVYAVSAADGRGLEQSLRWVCGGGQEEERT